MSGIFGAKSHRRKPSINITPLIDVMFLLLIFFMVSSTFREYMGIDIELPQAESATEQQQSPHEVAVDQHGHYYLDQERMELHAIKDALQSILESDPEAAIVLRADEQANVQQFVAILDLTRKIGAQRLIIPTQLPFDLSDEE